MTSILLPLTERHNCTVVETAKLCHGKLAPFHKIAKFHTIERPYLKDEYTFVSNLDLMLQCSQMMIDINEYCYDVMKEIIEKGGTKYDLLVTDPMFHSPLSLAEKYDLPAVVQAAGMPGGVEHIQDKMSWSVIDSLAFKLALRNFFNYLANLRTELDLPPFEDQAHFFPCDNYGRYPTLTPTSPLFYPEPHPSMDYLYIGGLRNASHYPPLTPELLKWIDSTDSDVVYISLGTHFALDPQVFKTFVSSLKEQKEFRVIWALGNGLQKVAESLEIKSGYRIWLSGYLPQYTVLGHPKVKIFVTHAGMGSVIDLVKRRKPSVFVPQFSDQFGNSQTSVSQTVGIKVDTFEFLPVKEAISKVFQDYQTYLAGVTALDKDFAKYEDLDRLDAFLQQLAAQKRVLVHVNLDFQFNSPAVRFVWMAIKGCFYFSIFIVLFIVTILLRNFFVKNSAKPKTN